MRLVKAILITLLELVGFATIFTLIYYLMNLFPEWFLGILIGVIVAVGFYIHVLNNYNKLGESSDDDDPEDRYPRIPPDAVAA